MAMSTSSPLPEGEKMLILSSAIAAGFNYYGYPAGIGADLDPAIVKGIQSAIGAFAGITFSQLASKALWGSSEREGFKDAWLSGFKSGTWQLLFSCATAGAVSYLLFPDNRMLQAGSVFLVPVLSKRIRGDYNF